MFKRVFFLASIVALLLVLAVFSTLVVSPDARRQAFTYVVPAYSLYEVMSLRRYVRDRDFVTSARRLERIIRVAKGLSRGRSQMVLGMVEAFALVMSSAKFEEDYDSLIGPLRELVELEPDLFIGRIWLARASLRREPQIALIHAQKAMELVSADERGYRLGIDSALRLDKHTLAREFCQRYVSSQFGGSKPRGYNHLFRGLGLRRLALSLIDRNGNTLLVSNSGLTLNKMTTYTFTLPHELSLKEFEVHLGTLPGLELMIDDLSVSGQMGVKSYELDSVLVTSKSAYVAENTDDHLRIITVANDDESIRFNLPETVSDATYIEISMSVKRLKIANGDVCDVQEVAKKE